MFRDYKRLNRVEERLDLVEREFKALELEWSTVYDKVRTTLAKLAKRDERSRQENAEGTAAPDPLDAQASSLTARGREIQRQILARRNRLPQNGAEHGVLPAPTGKNG